MKFNIDFLKRTTRDFLPGISCLLWLLGLLLLVLIISISVDINNKVNETENTISVSATSEVYAKPDLALTTFSVVIEAKTVAQAISENAEKMNAIIDFVKSQGVQEEDLKTVGFNIYPRYEWQKDISCIPPCPSGKRALVGYEVRQSLQVKVRDLSKIGDIVEGAVNKGANQVSDLRFTIDNEDNLKAQAREQAIEEAKDKAKELSSQLEVRLVRVIDFNEGSQMPRPYYYSMEEAENVDKGGGVEIETGENKISVTVNITYQIR